MSPSCSVRQPPSPFSWSLSTRGSLQGQRLLTSDSTQRCVATEHRPHPVAIRLLEQWGGFLQPAVEKQP